MQTAYLQKLIHCKRIPQAGSASLFFHVSLIRTVPRHGLSKTVVQLAGKNVEKKKNIERSAEFSSRFLRHFQYLHITKDNLPNFYTRSKIVAQTMERNAESNYSRDFSSVYSSTQIRICYVEQQCSSREVIP